MTSTLTDLSLASDIGVLANHRGGGDGEGFFFLLLLLAAIGGGVYLWRRRRGDNTAAPTPPPAPPTPPVSSARALLDERFARGEIDQAEYQHRRAVLAGETTAPVTAPEPPSSSGSESGDPDEGDTEPST
ncbi:MAG: SHOCT domain-containing protein [Actinomycetota bacterium]